MSIFKYAVVTKNGACSSFMERYEDAVDIAEAAVKSGVDSAHIVMLVSTVEAVVERKAIWNHPM